MNTRTRMMMTITRDKTWMLQRESSLSRGSPKESSYSSSGTKARVVAVLHLHTERRVCVKTSRQAGK
jgi:hypothetical protein